MIVMSRNETSPEFKVVNTIRDFSSECFWNRNDESSRIIKIKQLNNARFTFNY
jgi:hypothetical protein